MEVTHDTPGYGILHIFVISRGLKYNTPLFLIKDIGGVGGGGGGGGKGREAFWPEAEWTCYTASY